MDRQRVKSMLPAFNGGFLIAGRLVLTALGTNGDILGVFEEHTSL